jgi:hypothetical protein
MPLNLARTLIITALMLAAESAFAGPQSEGARTRSPHGTLEIACQNCHASSTWKPIRKAPDFDHNLQTKYPLEGQHRDVACVSCHVKPVFTDVGRTCASCHADLHRRQFGASCETCHSVKTWAVQARSVPQHINRFPLVGAHAALQCETCHMGAAAGTFTGLSTACMSCHSADYTSARSIDHRASGFSTSCESCHTMTQWRAAKFDHSASRFPLTGGHTSVTCAQCHVGGQFAGTPATCVSCHAKQFEAATTPNHLAAGFSHDCTTCHNTSRWQGAAFDHARTRFPLTGVHVTAMCASCHANGRFAGTPQSCVSCHLESFTRTTNPNHAAAGFPQDCTLCHATSAWRPASFDHARTRFPLTGSHTAVACSTCHVSGQFAGLSSACSTCHLNQYNATTSPNHTAAGFSRDCQICHSTVQWRGATFDHSRTRFALTGAHTTVQCANCHVGGRYAGTPTDCYSCHSREFTAVSNPNHVAAGFPKTCETCHATTTWLGARFSHRFPIYSGSHAGKWTTCNDCHTNSSNYAVFSCTNCHAHEKTTMDSKHRSIRGYAYESATCYTCHPTGSH